MKFKVFALIFALTLLAFSQTQPTPAPAAPDKPACCQHMGSGEKNACCHSGDGKEAKSCCGGNSCMNSKDMKDMKGCCMHAKNSEEANATDPNSCPGCCADMSKGCSMCNHKDGGKQAKCCGSGQCASAMHSS